MVYAMAAKTEPSLTVLFKIAEASKKSLDIWSLGIVLFELFYLKKPEFFSKIPKLLFLGRVRQQVSEYSLYQKVQVGPNELKMGLNPSVIRPLSFSSHKKTFLTKMVHFSFCKSEGHLAVSLLPVEPN